MFLISDAKLPCDKAFLKLYFAYAIIKLAIFTDLPLGWVADLHKMHNFKWIDERVTVFAKDFCNATRHLIMSTYHLAQEFLFQRIREMLPPQVSLADAVSEILHVSNDSAYLRIRNETPLLLEEAKELCDHFKLSLDQLFYLENNSVLFHTMRIDSKEYSFEKYLSDILTQLKKTEEISNSKIIYLTKDIPLFYHFISETFFAFRHFFWMKSILLHPDYLNAGFIFSELQPGIVSVGREIIKTYNRIPSTEIWNTECINSIILQVEYYKDAGYFSSASDIRIIYESI